MARTLENNAPVDALAAKMQEAENALRAAAPAPDTQPLFEAHPSGGTFIRGVGVVNMPAPGPGAEGGAG